MARMVKSVVVAVCSVVLVAAEAGVRDFTTTSGQVFRGELLDYNQATDRVTLKTEQGKTEQFKAGGLVDGDYLFVQDWDAVRLFSRTTHFRLYLYGPESLKKWSKIIWRRPPGNVEAQQTIKIDHNRVGYEIKFDNMTGHDLENVELKYNIIYMQERMDYWKEEKVQEIVVRPAVHRFPVIAAGKKLKFPSRTIVLRHKEVAEAGVRLRYLQGEGRFLKSEVLGMVFRASIKTRSGQATVREMRIPKDLSEGYAWVEPTAENTVWADDTISEKNDTKKPPTLWVEMGGSVGGD